MSFIKISELTEKVTLAGTEEVLINDSGTSKKMATQRFLNVQAAAEAAQTAAEAAQTAAETAETNAETAETNAAASASAASTSESNAATSESNAATSASNAATSESNAATSATNASNSASAAATSESNAATSESNAATSASNAATSESNAATSSTNASNSASAAATSATNASNSAGVAALNATSASNSASSASTSASNASASATAASNAQSAAETARDQTLTAFDNFDDRYLGTKASDPALDNDGNALVAGALYFNSTDGAMKVYDGSQWLAAYASLSGALLATNNLSDLNDTATARTNLGLGSAATTASTDYATAAQGSTADSAVQPGDNVSDLTNDAGYLTSFTETNDLTAAVTWANVPDINITQSSVTQHQAALSITEGQISNLGSDIVLDSDIGVTVQAYDANLVTYATNGNTAYGWGDHASAGYLTSYTETDPVFSASEAASITSTDTSNWDTAYGWGNHASASYITSTGVTYENLNTNGDVGTGADQVAAGNHNHSGVYEPADATILKDADIGVNVQAYNANLVTYATNGNTAYGWGDHASAGYLTGITGQSIKNLSDVYSSMTPSDGQLLTWDTTNGWQAEDAPVSLPTQTGHSGEYLTTDGSTASWAALSSDAVTASIPLAATKSVTAGRAVAIDSSGTVGNLPVTNSLGTEYQQTLSYLGMVNEATDSATSRGQEDLVFLSTDGSRALGLTLNTSDSGSSNAIITCHGIAINTAGTATQSGTTQTVTAVVSGASTSSTSPFTYAKYGAFAINTNTFLVFIYSAKKPDGTWNNSKAGITFRAVQVAADGAVSAGSEYVPVSNYNENAIYDARVGFLPLHNEKKLMWFFRNSGGSQVADGVISVSGTTISNGAQVDGYIADGYFSYLPQTDIKSMITPGNVVCSFGYDNNEETTALYYTNTNWNGSQLTSTSSTTTSNASLFSDFSGYFHGMFLSTSRALVFYKTSANQYIAKLLSVNSSTGVLTTLDTLVLQEDASSASYHVWEAVIGSDANSVAFIYNYSGSGYVNSLEISSDAFVGKNVPVLLGDKARRIKYSGANDEFILLQTDDDDTTVATNSVTYAGKYTVNAYSTSTFNYLGVAAETSSTSPVNVTVAGLASGFSGLTSGAKYYLDSSLNGTVSTATTSGIYVGKAVSSTQIALGVS